MSLRLPPNLEIAGWDRRFLAWLIDIVIISPVAWGVGEGARGLAGPLGSSDYAGLGIISVSGAVFFAYWAAMEWRTGMTVGKKVLDLRVVGTDGSRPGLWQAAVGSFGKAFVLPADVFFGWMITNRNRQRIFNKIADTFVVRLVEQAPGEPEGSD